MYIKIWPESPAFAALKEIDKRFEICNVARKALMEKLGFTECWSRDDPNTFYGGICGFKADKAPPGWRYAFPRFTKEAFWPKNTKANKALIEEIEALPIIKWTEICEATGYKYWQVIGHDERTGGIRHSYGPRVFFNLETEKYILMHVKEEATYDLLPGMVEITKAEFKYLEGLHLEKEKKETDDNVSRSNNNP